MSTLKADAITAVTADTNLALTGSGTGGVTSDGNEIITTVNIQYFTASGTYTPTSGMLYCIIEAIGGGGGGGGNQLSTMAGGGSSGGYSRSQKTAANVSTSQTVTIGAGGAGVAANTNGTGTAGGTTSVGSLVTANGGAGGTQTAPGVNTAAGTGDVAILGATGDVGSAHHVSHGGQGFFGGKTNASGSATEVIVGNGGKGGYNSGSGNTGDGGAVIITEFIK